MQVNPFKGTILVYQRLYIPEFFIVHSYIGNEKDAPVNISCIDEHLSYIMSGNMCKVTDCQSAHDHFALAELNDRERTGNR